MIPSSTPCGACGAPTLVKNFRGASVHVCQHCQRVTLSKADFKQLLSSASSLTPEVPVYREDPMPTEVTEELEGYRVSAFAATEIDHTSAGDIAIDEGSSGVFNLAAIRVDTPPGAEPRVSLASYADDDHANDDDDGFDAALDAYQQQRGQGQIWLMVGAVMIAVVLCGVAVAAASLGMLMTTPQGVEAVPALPAPTIAAPPAPVPGDPQPAKPATERPKPVPEAPAAPAPVKPPPVPAPQAAPPPKPAPAPSPEPGPAPAPSGPGALVNAGWGSVDRDLARAEDLFSQALALAPGHSEANYGYGYVLLKQGRVAEAKIPLCSALASGKPQSQLEIRALLSKNSMSCE